MKKITSRGNPLFRQLRMLRQQNQILVEGVKLSAEAVSAGLSVRAVILTDKALALPGMPKLLEQIAPDVPRFNLADHLMAKIADTVNPQGLALVCDEPVLAVPAAKPAPDGLYLVADGLQDPGNLGTMIRTADAFAFNAVIITAGTVYPFNDKVIRAAMGSAFRVRLISFAGIEPAAAWLKSGRVTLVAADLAGEDCMSADLPVPAALIIGNEARGLSASARKLADRKVSIPMPGNAESLNAAAAGAILSYELVRARKKMCNG